MVTNEERAFVESMLLAGQSGQGSSSFADDAAQLGTETQKTVKINHLSFNENGEKGYWMGPHTSCHMTVVSVKI